MVLRHMCISAGILIIFILILRRGLLYQLPKRTFTLLWKVAMLRLMIPFSIPVLYTSEMTAVSSMETAKAQGGSQVPWLWIVWLGTAAILLTVYGIRYWRQCRVLREALPWRHEESAFAERVCGKKVQIVVSDQIISPLTYGIRRPKIVLSPILDTKKQESLECVLTHEAVHIVYGDNLWKLLSGVLVCVYWFHPLVWLMHFMLKRDLELACDEKTVRLLGQEKRKVYIGEMIRMAERSSGICSGYSSSGKKHLQERMVALMKLNKAKIGAAAAAVVILGGSLTVFAIPKKEAVKSADFVMEDSRETSGEDQKSFLKPETKAYTEESEADHRTLTQYDDSIKKDEEASNEESKEAWRGLEKENQAIAEGDNYLALDEEAGEAVAREEEERAAEAVHEENWKIKENQDILSQYEAKLEAGASISQDEIERAAEAVHEENRRIIAGYERQQTK